MSKEMVEQVASYIYDKNVPYGVYNIFACYDHIANYHQRKVDFYDVYDGSGFCVNEGEPYYTLPSWQDIFDQYWLPSIREADRNHDRDLKFI